MSSCCGPKAKDVNSQEQLMVALCNVVCTHMGFTQNQQSAMQGLVLATLTYMNDHPEGTPSTSPFSTETRSTIVSPSPNIQPAQITNFPPYSPITIGGKSGKHNNDHHHSKHSKRDKRDTAAAQVGVAGSLGASQSVAATALDFQNTGHLAAQEHKLDAKAESDSEFELKKHYSLDYDFKFNRGGFATKNSSWVSRFFNASSVFDLCGFFSAKAKAIEGSKALDAEAGIKKHVIH